MNNFSSFISLQLKDNSIIKQEQMPQKHKISCKNCARLHHKCDKISPSCSHCLKKGIKCEVNPSVKKRGRPFGTTKDNLEKKKQNKRNVNTSNNTQDLPETKRVKILNAPREVPCSNTPFCTSAPINHLVFFQVPIDINWEFSFQDTQNGVNKNISQNMVSNQDVYGSQNVSCIQPTTFIPNSPTNSPNSQFYPSSDFSVSSPPSEESLSCDDFVLDVENFDFDNFNTFLDQEFQFC